MLPTSFNILGEPIAGTIVDNNFETDIEVTLFAIWLREPYEVTDSQNMLLAFIGSIAFPTLIGGGLLLFAFAIFYFSKGRVFKSKIQQPKPIIAKQSKHKAVAVNTKQSRLVLCSTNTAVPATICKPNNNSYSSKGSYSNSICYDDNESFTPKRHSRVKGFGIVTVLVSMLLVLVLSVHSSEQLPFSVNFAVRQSMQQSAITRELRDKELEEQRQRELEQERRDNANSIIKDVNNGITEREAFLYTQIILDLITFGFDVFPANAVLTNGSLVAGFAYTDFHEVFENDYNEYFYIASGFVPLLNQHKIPDKDIEHGVLLHSVFEDDELDTSYKFLLAFESGEDWIKHYIAFDEYVIYEISDLQITKTVQKSNQNIWRRDLGLLFDHDLERIVFDPNLGKEFRPDGFSLNEVLDYDFAQLITELFLLQQEENMFTVQSLTMFSISMEALGEFRNNNQDERFLGLSVESLRYVEQNLDNAFFYYIDHEGNIGVLELYPAPQAPIWQRILMGALAVWAIAASIAIGIVTKGALAKVSAIGVKWGIGLLVAAITGAVLAATINLVAQVTIGGTPLDRVDWEQVGWSAMIGAATGMLSMGFGAVTASITQKLNAAIKLATQMLTYGIIGGLAGATNAWMMNGWQWDWQQIGIGFGVGAAFAVLLFVGCKLVSATIRSIKHNFGSTKLYRAVDKNEFLSIRQTGRFELKYGGAEMKQFGRNFAETKAFANLSNSQGHKYSHIIRVKIPTKHLHLFDHTPVDAFNFTHGTVTVDRELMNSFNRFIRNINFVVL